MKYSADGITHYIRRNHRLYLEHGRFGFYRIEAHVIVLCTVFFPKTNGGWLHLPLQWVYSGPLGIIRMECVMADHWWHWMQCMTCSVVSWGPLDRRSSCLTVNALFQVPNSRLSGRPPKRPCMAASPSNQTCGPLVYCWLSWWPRAEYHIQVCTKLFFFSVFMVSSCLQLSL